MCLILLKVKYFPWPSPVDDIGQSFHFYIASVAEAAAISVFVYYISYMFFTAKGDKHWLSNVTVGIPYCKKVSKGSPN